MAGHAALPIVKLEGDEERVICVGKGDHASLEAHASLAFNKEYERLVKEGWHVRDVKDQTVVFKRGGGVIALTYLGG